MHMRRKIKYLHPIWPCVLVLGAWVVTSVKILTPYTQSTKESGLISTNAWWIFTTGMEVYKYWILGSKTSRSMPLGTDYKMKIFKQELCCVTGVCIWKEEEANAMQSQKKVVIQRTRSLCELLKSLQRQRSQYFHKTWIATERWGGSLQLRTVSKQEGTGSRYHQHFQKLGD